MKRLERISVRGFIKGGQLLYKNARWFKGMLSLYEDCEVLITVERRQKKRSVEQMGYLFGVVYPTISDHTGHTPEELHDIYKTKFLRKKVEWQGAKMVIVGTTQKLTTNQMAEFVTNIILDAAEMGIEIPPADKLYQFK